MKCPQCGGENPPQNKFCGECGFNLKTFAAIARMNFVKKDIPESLVKKILLTKDTIEKERRNVTVVFVDIAGFTTISEALDPEELTLLMNECFRKLSMMVYRYEGIIDKFIGDCIMAIFGAPVSHEDDPERAILASLDMQLAIDDINARLDKSFKKLKIHTGINTGEVIAGRVGSDLQMDYTVMGDTVNVGQRLKDIATPGTIIAGPETYQRTRHAFDFMSSKPLQLKGKTEIIIPYEVIGRKWGMEFGTGALHADLIGRDLEFSKLKEGYNNLIANRSSIFFIKGEIGVGKSRLLYEFRKFLSISVSDIALFEGRGISYESAIPYKSFADCLCRYLLAGELKNGYESAKLISNKIRELLDGEADEVAPYIYKLLNFELDKKQQEKIVHLDTHSLQLQIFLAVSTLFEKISNKIPIVFILDDVQWVDSASRELINFLLPMVKKKRSCFYFSCRIGEPPSLQKIFNTIQSELGDYTVEINLTNLNARDSAQLIDNLGGKDFDISLKDYIIEKSDGNPFFIEEMIRNILESEAKENIKPENFSIPGSIEAAVTSRIDSLSKEAKHLLKIASVIGRSFPKPLLEVVVKEKEIYQQAVALETAEFLLRVNKDNKIFYSFRHPIFQEVAYHSLLKSERINYHKIIAAAIEAKFRDDFEDFFAILAHHYYHGQDYPKALAYSLKAGEEAAALYANEEALTYYKQALLVAQDESTKAEILENIGDIQLVVGEVDEASGHFQKARELVKDKIIQARISGKVARILVNTGKSDQGIETMKLAIESITGSETAVLIELNYQFADFLLERKAEIEEAAKLAVRGIEISKRIKDTKLAADGLRLEAQLFWRKGNYEQALAALKESQHIYQSIKHHRDMPQLFILMGVVSNSMGDLNRAIDYVKQAISLSQKIGNQRLLAIGYNNLGIYYDLTGDFKNALDYYEKNLAIRRKIRDLRGEAVALGNIGILKSQTGKRDAALEYYNKAREIMEKIGDARGMVHTYFYTAGLLLSMDKKEQAAEFYEKALKIAAEKQDKIMLSEARYQYALYYLNTGNITAAFDLLEQAREVILATENKDMISRLFVSLADIYIKKGDAGALRYAEDGLRLAIETKIKGQEILAFKTLGKAQAMILQDFAEGVKNIKRAITIAGETNFVYEMAEAIFALGEVLIVQKRPESALEYLNQAKTIYQKIDAKLRFKRVEELINRIKSNKIIRGFAPETR